MIVEGLGSGGWRWIVGVGKMGDEEKSVYCLFRGWVGEGEFLGRR